MNDDDDEDADDTRPPPTMEPASTETSGNSPDERVSRTRRRRGRRRERIFPQEIRVASWNFKPAPHRSVPVSSAGVTRDIVRAFAFDSDQFDVVLLQECGALPQRLLSDFGLRDDDEEVRDGEWRATRADDTDPDDLCVVYRRGKVRCMPSRWNVQCVRYGHLHALCVAEASTPWLSEGMAYRDDHQGLEERLLIGRATSDMSFFFRRVMFLEFTAKEFEGRFGLVCVHLRDKLSSDVRQFRNAAMARKAVVIALLKMADKWRNSLEYGTNCLVVGDFNACLPDFWDSIVKFIPRDMHIVTADEEQKCFIVGWSSQDSDFDFGAVVEPEEIRDALGGNWPKGAVVPADIDNNRVVVVGEEEASRVALSSHGVLCFRYDAPHPRERDADEEEEEEEESSGETRFAVRIIKAYYGNLVLGSRGNKKRDLLSQAVTERANLYGVQGEYIEVTEEVARRGAEDAEEFWMNHWKALEVDSEQTRDGLIAHHKNADPWFDHGKAFYLEVVNRSGAVIRVFSEQTEMEPFHIDLRDPVFESETSQALDWESL